jgi:hypothetical protein
MRWDKVTLVIVGAGCVAGLIVFAVRFALCPMEIKVEAVDPSLMVDRSLIVTLGLTKGSSEAVRFDLKSLQVDAKVGRGWVGITNVWAGLPILILVPPETQVCRVRLNYSPKTLKERLGDFVLDHAPRLLAKFPALRSWLWPPRPLGWTRPLRWTEGDFEVRLPEAPAAAS